MKRVIVDMQNALFADAIATSLRDFDSDFEVFPVKAPTKQRICVPIQRRMSL